MSEDKSKPLFGENAFVPVLLGLPIMLLAAGGIWAFRSRGSVMATLEQGEAAGRAYAASSSTTAKRSPSECLDGAIGSLDDLAEPRGPGAAAFLAACLQVSGHALMLEIIPPRQMVRDDETIHRAMKRLYNLGIHPEWWKLEPMSPSQWQAVDALIAERDPYCRGVLVLGMNASVDVLAASFRDARASRSCRGFAIGRTIFEAPARAWLANAIDDAELKRRVRDHYETLINAWREAKR